MGIYTRMCACAYACLYALLYGTFKDYIEREHFDKPTRAERTCYGTFYILHASRVCIYVYIICVYRYSRHIYLIEIYTYELFKLLPRVLTVRRGPCLFVHTGDRYSEGEKSVLRSIVDNRMYSRFAGRIG